MSRTYVPVPIVSALVTSEVEIGPDRVWLSRNDLQKRFLAKCFVPGRTDVTLLKDYLKAMASRSADELNKFLRDNGFSIQLDPLGPNSFGVVSILDVLVNWLVRGKPTTIRTSDHQSYPGVKLKVEDAGVRFFSLRDGFQGRSDPVVSIETQEGLSVNMLMCDAPECDSQLFDWVESIRKGLQSVAGFEEYTDVQFPKVNLRETVNLSWLVGLATVDAGGGPVTVEQALQETKFRMNEVGAHAESAVAIALLRGCSFEPARSFVIDKPFLLWIEMPGVSMPLFTAYLTHEDWKDPGSLR